MLASELIKELEKLDPDTDVTTWIRCRQTSKVETLPFVISGIALNIIIPILGKPMRNYNRDGGRRLNCRVVIWRATDVEETINAANQLIAANIKEFMITLGNYFTIHIPYEAFVTSFLSSNDPEEWKKRNDKRFMATCQRKTAKILAREEQRRLANEELERRIKEIKDENQQAELAEKKSKERADRLAAERRQALLATEQKLSRSIELHEEKTNCH